MATLNIIAEDKLRENAEAMGDLICDSLKSALAGLSGVVTIRHVGLMIGIELDRPCADLVKMALQEKLLINVTAEKVVRLLPPLILSEQDAKELVNRLVPLIRKFLS
ncbi:MAG TPA: aminotransferase class III-fold pyridoxal phosphate-dependent enzyme [Rugosibacter sp.]|nr:aminotransferase class III-fold pyridoxal phosphate-dependent enzyme [Rugosibacter sp.]